MKFKNRLRTADDRNYEYNAKIKVEKLGRRPSRSIIRTADNDAAPEPQIKEVFKKARNPPFHHEMDVDVAFWSSLDSYRNVPKMLPKILFIWGTTPGHTRNLFRILEGGDKLFLAKILLTFRRMHSDRITELTTHDIGRHLVQKLLDVGSEDDRLTVLKTVSSKPRQLINIACNSNGNAVVEKMIKMFKILPGHISLLLSNLEQDALTLTIDRLGQSVVYCCLRILNRVQCKFIFETLALHFMEIIRGNKSHDGFGGVVMIQYCLKTAPNVYQERLSEKLAGYAHELVSHPVGHHLLLDLLNNSKWSEVSKILVAKLKGNFAHLATHIISSRVVHECLILSSRADTGMSLESIIRELIQSPLSFPIQNVHAESVIRLACSLSNGQLLEDLKAAFGRRS